MRYVLPALMALLSLAGCASMSPYTSQDLQQVTDTYNTLRPLYLSFRTAFLTHNGPVLERDFKREQRVCKQVDRIDRRDTIDPNTNLFAVSAAMDNFCNDIEEYYAAWRKSRHLPYDHSVHPGDTTFAFKDTEKYLKLLGKQIKHPSDLT